MLGEILRPEFKDNPFLQQKEGESYLEYIERLDAREAVDFAAAKQGREVVGMDTRQILNARLTGTER
ncbi:hypothetical protein JW758_04545 [Candidatus Peregrinibacteria bacterium]|nr:hypothetical protein [Candidatus Peregrinibacteria bacterium]